MTKVLDWLATAIMISMGVSVAGGALALLWLALPWQLFTYGLLIAFAAFWLDGRK